MAADPTSPAELSLSGSARPIFDRAEALLAAEDSRRAVALLDEALRDYPYLPPSDTFRLLMLKSEGHRRLAELGHAIAATTRALALSPDDEIALDKLVHLAALTGHSPETRRHRDRLLEIRASHLPERIIDGLDMIWDRVGDVQLDSQAVAWAWELADKSAWERAEWLRAAAWGKEARLLVRQWREALPAQAHQLDALFEDVDLGALHAAMMHSDTCILAGAHLGPSAAAVSLLQQLNRPLWTLGTPDRARREEPNLIQVGASNTATMRTLLRIVKQGATIGLMADGFSMGETIAVEFLGRRIELSVLPPRLIRAYRATSLWCCPLWHGRRIVLDVERLPDPLPGEPRGEWTQRWLAAYLDKVARVMRGRPENLGLFSGIWGNVNTTVGLERERQRANGKLRAWRLLDQPDATPAATTRPQHASATTRTPLQ